MAPADGGLGVLLDARLGEHAGIDTDLSPRGIRNAVTVAIRTGDAHEGAFELGEVAGGILCKPQMFCMQIDALLR